ncbi:hypothetical protein ALC53_04141 [Atta colombica]|uniref:Uncharacterized protein n=1 Tax=Atta colombica TaxID=520822 RepID=A0A151I5A1_9HYME|nr:hypothetical protein ALC53_04141 [Atta colombica]
MKKYASASTAYKFLDIGIIVGFISHVQIVINNNGGNRMFISTYKTFIERLIQDLNVNFVKIYDMNNVKLTLNGTYLYMKPTTILFLSELEQ